jgi:hypothetical protein
MLHRFGRTRGFFKRQSEAPSIETSCAAGSVQFPFPHAHHALAAFEGLFVASILSLLFWSTLTFTLCCLK